MHLVHNVYFTMHDNSPGARETLLAGMRKYLAHQPGVVYFSAGLLADLSRPINDRAFDVGLHIVFADRAAHDAYQVSADHVTFIEEHRANWKQVRAFDSDATPSALR